MATMHAFEGQNGEARGVFASIALNPLVTAITIGLIAATLPGTAESAPGVSIVTINLAKETSPDRILAELRAAPPLRDADVYLLQEVAEQDGQTCVAFRLATALGMQVAYFPEAAGVTDRGLAILSRYPLRDTRVRTLKQFDLHFHSRARFALVSTAVTPWAPLRLVNVHLDTRLNVEERLAQIEPVLRDGAAFQGSRVIAGDFNSNPFYWLQRLLPVPSSRTQSAAIEAFMTKHGFRAAVPESVATHDLFGMHLDWIWVAGLRPAAWRVIPLQFSDHHAVWARVEF